MNTSKIDAQSGFRALDHRADKAIEAWAPDLKRLFRAAAEGMFSESADPAVISADQEWAIQVQASTVEDLLQAWLSELLWIAERDEAVLCEFELSAVEQMANSWSARGRARGGPVPPDSPHTGAPVKAVTYHELRVWQDGDLWRAHLVFDV